MFGIDAVSLLVFIGNHFDLRQTETARIWVFCGIHVAKFITKRLLQHSLRQVESVVTGLEEGVSCICLKTRCLTCMEKGRLGGLEVIHVTCIHSMLRCYS